MQTIKILHTILLSCLILLTSYIIIMDDKQIIINSNINNLCKTNFAIFVLALFCFILLFFLAQKIFNFSIKKFLHHTNALIQQ